MKTKFIALFVSSILGKSTFQCPRYEAPPRPSNDVRKVNPAHVDLTMAFGDSISAAFAARAGVQEDRDIAFSGGEGTKDQMTFPWLMSQYNYDVEGMSTKRAFPMDFWHLPSGDYHSKTDHLNFAESSGSVFRGSLDEQWGLLQKTRGDYENFDSKWKVLTVWLFSNDVCGQCKADMNGTDEMKTWVGKYDEFFQNVTTTMSNTIVNIMIEPDLSYIHKAQQETTFCAELHDKWLRECGCIDRGTDEELSMLDHNVHVGNE
jgi:hypothetical protein